MSEPRSGTVQVVTLLASDLVDSTRFITRIGDVRAAEVLARHDRIARDLMLECGAREIDKTDGFLLTFARPADAVTYAIAYHDALARLATDSGERLDARIGIHLGEIVIRDNILADVARGAKPTEFEGLAKPIVARVMSLATARQTLLTRSVFDLARRGSLGSQLASESLTWLAHGSYLAKGIDDPIEVFEVGRTGLAPLVAPVDTGKVRAIPDPDMIVGWRPAPGADMPGRPNWVLEERAGIGGFGDVWRAVHRKTGEQRVFKFCYDREKLRALKHEVRLVKLLKEELGDRRDIARILDWNFDETPYFIESEWTEGGSLDAWFEHRGGVAAVPLVTRVEIIAQIADALAAAHSVGVLHKDIKPSNVLMTQEPGGEPRAKLTDFGIGLATNRDRLSSAGITELNFTARENDDDLTSMTGTRLYQAPEILENKPATVHADVYALGVVLYQVVVGDISRALSPGWERDIPDSILREDIAAAVDGRPEERIDPRGLAKRLRELDARRAERERLARVADRTARSRTRRRWVSLAAGALLLVAAATGIQLRRVAVEAQRANRAAETSRRVSEFMTGLFRLADPGEARGNTVTAREILDEGARRIDAELRDQPQVQATLMATMGRVYLGLGLAKSAKPIIQRSLAIRQRVLGTADLETADGLVLMADAEEAVGDYKSSERYYQQALDIRRRTPSADEASVGQALLGLATARTRSANFAGATNAGEEAATIFRRLGGHARDLASTVIVLANAQFATGQYPKADTLYRRALELAPSAFGSYDRRVALVMNNLGLTLAAERQFEEADRYLRESGAMWRKLVGNDHPTVAMNDEALGALLQQRGRLAEAEALHREALAIHRARSGLAHPATGGAMTMLAWVLADEGRCAESETLARDARALLQRALPKGHWAIAHSESVLGECLGRRRSDTEAEALLIGSLPVLQKNHGGPIGLAAISRVIAFYERRGDKAKAAEYRRLLPSGG